MANMSALNAMTKHVLGSNESSQGLQYSANFPNNASDNKFWKFADVRLREHCFGSTHLSSCKETHSRKSNMLDDFGRISFTFLKRSFLLCGKMFAYSKKQSARNSS